MLNTIIQQQFGSVLSNDIKFLSSSMFNGPINFSNLVFEVKKVALEIGRNMLNSLLEMAGKALSQSPRVRHEFVIRDRRSRTIVTELGCITYEKYYYRNKTTKEY
ncbi:UPF0236 family protein [Ligilactobacillus equi]|uniref:UPF0236 family transposase-like protein n=1 Tax=Ligilactobacillus equi TaxID=137357 RepID=UPI002ED06DB7